MLPMLTTIPKLHFLTNRLEFLARWNYKSNVIRLNQVSIRYQFSIQRQ